jgi:hypothetical protein
VAQMRHAHGDINVPNDFASRDRLADLYDLSAQLGITPTRIEVPSAFQDLLRRFEELFSPDAAPVARPLPPPRPSTPSSPLPLTPRPWQPQPIFRPKPPPLRFATAPPPLALPLRPRPPPPPSPLLPQPSLRPWQPQPSSRPKPPPLRFATLPPPLLPPLRPRPPPPPSPLPPPPSLRPCRRHRAFAPGCLSPSPDLNRRRLASRPCCNRLRRHLTPPAATTVDSDSYKPQRQAEKGSLSTTPPCKRGSSVDTTEIRPYSAVGGAPISESEDSGMISIEEV